MKDRIYFIYMYLVGSVGLIVLFVIVISRMFVFMNFMMRGFLVIIGVIFVVMIGVGMLV